MQQQSDADGSNEELLQADVDKDSTGESEREVSGESEGEEPAFLKLLREQGLRCGLGPIPDPGTRPPWLDVAKFEVGQRFARDYYAGIAFAETCSLLALFLFEDGLKPLIWTGASGTPYTAFRRYLSTAVRVKSWFETDVWTEGSLGYSNVRAVNAMHTRVNRAINDGRPPPSTYKPTPPLPHCCAMAPVLRSAALACCANQRPDSSAPQPVLYFSQCSLSITQWGFVGMVVTFPSCFGAGNATDEQLEAFLHVWRALGFQLGIKDQFNFCSGSLQEVRERCRDLVQHWILPKLGRVSDEWEHYCRCMCRGISFYVKDLSFEVTLAYLCWTLDVDVPEISKALTWLQYIKLQFSKVFLCFMLRVPFLLAWFNWAVKKSVAGATRFSEDKHAELRSKTLCECRR